MPQSPSEAPTVSVRLICSEVVVAGGARITQWQIRDQSNQDIWHPAYRHPSCSSERGQAAPGTVWQETLTLQLEPGTALKQVIAEPLPAKPKSAFDYLRKEVRSVPRKTREITYIVGKSGELLRNKP